jgi:hypothetical protein
MSWRQHHGGACPTHEQAKVVCRYACGHQGKPTRAGGLRWSHRGEPFDIVAYQVDDVPEEVKA